MEDLPLEPSKTDTENFIRMVHHIGKWMSLADDPSAPAPARMNTGRGVIDGMMGRFKKAGAVSDWTVTESGPNALSLRVHLSRLPGSPGEAKFTFEEAEA